MSDRVRYLCANGGEVGFPFLLDRTGGPSAFYPVAMDLLLLVELWWRVKSWSLSTDLSLTDAMGHTFTQANGPMDPALGMPVRELNLITNCNASALVYNVFSLAGTGYSASFSILGSGAIRLSGGLLYPGLQISAGVASNLVTPIESVQLDTTFTSSPQIPATIAGVPVPMGMDATSFPPTSYTASFLHITPVEWWPFADINGNPIFNTATGALLPGKSPLD